MSNSFGRNTQAPRVASCRVAPPWLNMRPLAARPRLWPLRFLPAGQARVAVPLEPGGPLAAFALSRITAGRKPLSSNFDLDFPSVSLLSPPDILLAEDGPSVRGVLPLREGRAEFLPLGAAGIVVMVYDGNIPAHLLILLKDGSRQ